MDNPRQWTLTIQAPAPWVTANHRGHTRNIARAIRPWREAAYWAAKYANLPKGLALVQIDTVARFRGRAPVRDRLNLYPTIKAVVDGLGPRREIHYKDGRRAVAVGYGLVPDDDDKHVHGPTIEIGPKLTDVKIGPIGELVVTITDLSAVARG